MNTDGAVMCALVYVCVGMSENLEGLQRSMSSSSNTLQHSVLNFLKKIEVVVSSQRGYPAVHFKVLYLTLRKLGPILSPYIFSK